jgi:hypothetical protein
VAAIVVTTGRFDAEALAGADVIVDAVTAIAGALARL